MTNKYWLALTPSLVVGVAIMISAFIAVRAVHSGWLIMAAPLFLAFSVLAADSLNSRLRGASALPSPAALILAAALVLSCLILTPKNSTQIASMLPMLGIVCWIILRPNNRRKRCASFPAESAT
jgi:hypothetical protein